MGLSVKIVPLWGAHLGPGVFPVCLGFMVLFQYGGGAICKAPNTVTGTEHML